MPLTYRSQDQFFSEIQAEFLRQQSSVDPAVFDSWSRGFVGGVAAAAKSLDITIQELERQLFPQFAEGEFLTRWGGYENLYQLPARGAYGIISITGILGQSIPALTEFSANGLKYATNTTVIINEELFSVTLTRSGTTVTASFLTVHNIGNGQSVTVASATTGYAGTYNVVVVDAYTVQFTVVGTPTTPASGTISIQRAVANVECTSTGQETNLISGAALTATGLSAIVTHYGVSGGASAESDDAFRARIMLSRSDISGVFTKSQIQVAGLSVAGNTRVFVITPNDRTPPYPGQVFVYVIRDDDANIIPSQPVLDETKSLILTNGKLPAHTHTDDVVVSAPSIVSVNITFSSLTPNTQDMKDAVRAELNAFFTDKIDFETSIPLESLYGAISNAQSIVTGDSISTFALSAPAAPIVITAGQLAVLGTVTFPA